MKNKYTYTAVMTALVAAFNAVVVPLMLLVTLNIIDYITGLIAARYRSQKINSYKSAHGIFKKISGWLLILVGADLDILISYAAENIGLKIPVVYAIAALVAVWLTCNEIISVLENINDIGVKIPKFLKRLTKHVKTTVEKSVETDEKSDGDTDDTLQ